MVDDAPLAARSTRLLGQILDAVVASLGVAAMTWVTLDDQYQATVLGRIAAAAGLAYFLFGDALPGGQSLAKRWLDLAVVDATTGEPCRPGQSFLRNVTSALGPLDWLFIFGEHRQRLGDKLANTLVVERA
jgi:uncharacterized RDD family membrane protein YckC